MIILFSFSAFLVHMMGNLGMRGKQIEGRMLCQCKNETARIKLKFMAKPCLTTDGFKDIPSHKHLNTLSAIKVLNTC